MTPTLSLSLLAKLQKPSKAKVLTLKDDADTVVIGHWKRSRVDFILKDMRVTRCELVESTLDKQKTDLILEGTHRTRKGQTHRGKYRFYALKQDEAKKLLKQDEDAAKIAGKLPTNGEKFLFQPRAVAHVDHKLLDARPAQKVSYPGFEEFEFCVHNDHDGYWRVSEVSSARVIGTGQNRKAALTDAYDVVFSKRSLEELRTAIGKALTQNAEDDAATKETKRGKRK